MRALLRHFLVVSLLAAVITGLQVTPNSPCSSLCLDSSDSNASDPRSSNTNDSDIMCSDKDYASDKGKKFEGCMNCLQNSTYSQGSENDQTWFVCMFSIPDPSRAVKVAYTDHVRQPSLRLSLLRLWFRHRLLPLRDERGLWPSQGHHLQRPRQQHRHRRLWLLQLPRRFYSGQHFHQLSVMHGLRHTARLHCQLYVNIPDTRPVTPH